MTNPMNANPIETNEGLKSIAHELGDKKEYFQGAGGNVSVKVDDSCMLVKASGVRISDMTHASGAVAVRYGDIRNYFYEKNPAASPEHEKESESAIFAAMMGASDRRPSMETGFYALLGKAVLHTHSVYANLITCSDQFESLVARIFGGLADEAIAVRTIPYAKPGYFLTHAIKDVLGSYNPDNEQMAIFMKNHGIIISAHTMADAISIHEKINGMIIGHFNLQKLFPAESEQAAYLRSFAASHMDMLRNIESHMLFPDLIVFCKELSVNEPNESSAANAKIIIDPNTGDFAYNTNPKEAAFIEENLTAWTYLIQTMSDIGLNYETLPAEEIGALEQMDAEKYRKKMVD